ncbi:MAG: CRISPR-associated endonuclease Cas2 [Thermoplasmatales archaeon]
MFVIIVYDVEIKRVYKVLKICRKYLTWVQNSVLEGEIEESSLMKLLGELKAVIEESADSLLIYKFRTIKYFSRELIGVEKGKEDQFLL